MESIPLAQAVEAPKQGHATEQLNLGMMYQTGHGVLQNYVQDISKLE